MAFTRQHWILLFFTFAYILGFGHAFLARANYEFLGYIGVLVFFFILVATTLHRSRFPLSVLWGLSVWGLLHVAGGGVPVGDGVLYGTQLIPLFDGGGDFFILKYDQLVHAFGFGVATLVVYHLIKPHLSSAANWGVVYFVLIAAGMGLGVINELVEFAAVLSIPETGVGGYENTLLDLTSNTIGAILAVVFIHFKRTRPVVIR